MREGWGTHAHLFSRKTVLPQYLPAHGCFFPTHSTIPPLGLLLLPYDFCSYTEILPYSLLTPPPRYVGGVSLLLGSGACPPSLTLPPHVSPLVSPHRPLSLSLGRGLSLDCIRLPLQSASLCGVSLSFASLVHGSLHPHLVDPVVPFLRSFGSGFPPFLAVCDAKAVRSSCCFIQSNTRPPEYLAPPSPRPAEQCSGACCLPCARLTPQSLVDACAR